MMDTNNLDILYKRQRHNTLQDLFAYAVTNYANAPAFLIDDKETKETYSLSYRDFGAQVMMLAHQLRSKGYHRDTIAIMGNNSPAWVMAYFAIIISNNIAVPLDKGLPREEIISILTRSQCKGIFFEQPLQDTVYSLADSESLVLEDRFPLPSLHNTTHSTLHTSSRDTLMDLPASEPLSMAVLLFTSGTTSASKAVMLSHRNLCENVFSYTSCVNMNVGDTVLAVLPFHHTYGSMAGMLSVVSTGACNVFADGLKHIGKIIQKHQVSIFMSVPLLVESLCNAIIKEMKKDGIWNSVEKRLQQSPRFTHLTMEQRRNRFPDVLEKFGGKLRLIMSGASPFNPKTAQIFSDFGILPAQIYGLTETAPAVTIESEKSHRIGSVGRPVPGVTVAIDTPDENGIGEIIVKGSNVMMGYFHDTLATARAIKNDWFYTGDLGYLDNDGFLYLKGRSKNVIVLKNGKNVFPEELESLVEPLPYVKECMVLGVPRRGRDKDDLVICLKIVYDAAYVTQYLGEENLRSCIEKDIDKLNQRLPKFKKIHKLVITDQPLVRTSTSKVKRFEEGRLLASTGS